MQNIGAYIISRIQIQECNTLEYALQVELSTCFQDSPYMKKEI